MRRLLATLGVGLSLALASGWAAAHIRLVHISNGKPLSWSSPTDISIVINDQGSADIPDASDDVAVRLAIDSWNQVQGTRLSLLENSDPIQRARTDFGSSSIHLVLFDEDGSTGWFPNGSGVVAVTPIFFNGNGTIQDADVLMNGKDYRFTTTGESLRFDVQDIMTHELGHFLGLDHSGCAGATMHPYVDQNNILHRSPSPDDVSGLRQMEPAASFAELTGTVRRETGSAVVQGAYVSVTDADGRTAGGALTRPNGTFAIEGLDAGDYSVAVIPLDEPVADGNLTSWYTIEADFEPYLVPASVSLARGESLDLGTLSVPDDVSVNLGRAADRYPKRVIIGDTTTVTVRGNGLFTGGTLTSSDPDVVLTPISWLGSQVTFQVVVPPTEGLGLVDLSFEDSIGRRAFLPGALELTPPNPVLTNVTPSVLTSAGGTNVFLSGSGFSTGARVVIGDRWYGEGTGLVFHDENTLEVTTAPTALGTHDVVVIDRSGVEGRLTDAVDFAQIPVVSSLIPTSGSSAGGTTVTVSGGNFTTGVVVRIGGVVQNDVTVVDDARLEIVTTAGTVGRALVEVENPGEGSDSSAYEYVAMADPSVHSLSPPTGTAAGGTVLEFTGADLSGITEVRFGEDLTGGGSRSLGLALEVVDSTTVRVTTPPMSAGVVDVLLVDGSSGQGVLLTDGYTFVSSGGSSGGGCGAVPPFFGSSNSPWNAWWVGALALILVARRSNARAPRTTRLA